MVVDGAYKGSIDIPISLDFGDMIFRTGLTLSVTGTNASVVMIYNNYVKLIGVFLEKGYQLR